MNTLCSGFVWTTMWEEICERIGRGREYFDEHVERYCHTSRSKSLENITVLTAFLTLDKNTDITGQSLNITGWAELY